MMCESMLVLSVVCVDTKSCCRGSSKDQKLDCSSFVTMDLKEKNELCMERDADEEKGILRSIVEARDCVVNGDLSLHQSSLFFSFLLLGLCFFFLIKLLSAEFGTLLFHYSILLGDKAM